MSAERTFCPRCGDAVDPEETLGRPDADRAREAELCRDCYFEAFELVDLPDRLRVRICTSCGAVHRDGGWVDDDETDETGHAIDAVGNALRIHRAAGDVAWEVEPVRRDSNSMELVCTIRAVVHGRPMEETHSVLVTFARETCRRCGRIAGNAYAGTVQLRGTDRPATADERDRALSIAEDVVERMREKGDRDAFVSDVVDRPEGVDIRVSTNKLGAQVADRLIATFGGRYDTSETLVTEDEDGQGVYRVTYAVRLPRFPPGTIIDPGDGEGPVLVRSVVGNLKGRRLLTGEAVELSDPRDPSIERLAAVEDATPTTLVAEIDERSIQVLDPETHRAETVSRPPDVRVDGETVQVVKTDRGVFVLPNETVPAEGADVD